MIKGHNIPTYILLIAIGLFIILAAVLAYAAAPRLRNASTSNPPETIEYTFPETQIVGHTKTPDANTGRLCIQVETSAYNPTTGETRIFPTPCDVPDGWQPFSS